VMTLLLIIVSPVRSGLLVAPWHALSHTSEWSHNYKFTADVFYAKASEQSIASLAVISMCAFGFRLGFGHVCTSLSFAVPLGAFAVVDVGRGI